MSCRTCIQALSQRAQLKVSRAVVAYSHKRVPQQPTIRLQKLTPFLFAGIAGIVAAEPAHAGLLDIDYTLPMEWFLFTVFMIVMEKSYFNPRLAFMQERDMFIRRKLAERERAIEEAERKYQEELAKQEAQLKEQMEKERREEARRKEQEQKALEEEKIRLAKEMRQQQFEMHDLYNQLVEEMQPMATKLGDKIKMELEQYKDIDTCIANFPTKIAA